MDNKSQANSLDRPIVAVTLDLDWAPNAIIRYALNLLNEAGIRATIFSTHKVEIKGHEVALHPNFEIAKPPAEVLDELQKLYPGALGVRSHALQISSRYYRLYAEKGLTYSSSYYMFNQQIFPFVTTGKMIEIPIFFEDDLYFAEFNDFQVRVNELDLSRPGIKVFNFHPVHLFLNTHSMDHYLKAKPDYQIPDLLKKHVGQQRGTRDFFSELCEYAAAGKVELKTLAEIEAIARAGAKI